MGARVAGRWYGSAGAGEVSERDLVIAALPLPLVLVGANGSVIGCNDAWLELSDATDEYASGLGQRQACAWERLEARSPGAGAVVERLVGAAAGGVEQVTTVAWGDAEDGSSLQVAATPASADGVVLVSFLLARDAVGAHRWSDGLLTQARGMLKIGVWGWDIAGGRQYWSPENYGLMGYRPGEVAASMDAFIARVHPEDRERVVQGSQALLSRVVPLQHLEYRVLLPDSRLRYHRAVAEAHFLADGSPSEIVGASQDVTEEVLAQQALYAVLQEAPLPLILCDQRGKVLLANRNTETVFGWTPEELQGQDVGVLSSDDVEQHRVYMEYFRATGEASTPEGLVVGRSREVIARRRDGSVFPADLSVSSFVSETGERRYLGIILDQTARKTAEEELLRSERSRALGTLVAGVAHDFNNLLTGIVGGLSLLRDHPDEERWLSVAERSAERASALVQQLLQVARRGDGESRWFEPGPVVEQAVRLATETFDRRIELSLTLEPLVGGVIGDRAQLDQVVLNLLVNARDAVLDRTVQTESRAYVPHIRVVVQGSTLEGSPAASIYVSDNGSGMTPEVLKRAFDPFFTTKEDGRGTGLGLAMVDGIVRSHGGTVRVDTAPGTGCMVEVVLPLHPEPGAAMTALADQEPSSAGRQVLVVDDEPLVGDVAAAYLRTAGYQVTLVGGGAAALDWLERHGRPDLVVLDANMPRPDGWQVLRQVQRLPDAPPVVIMSGLEASSDALARGAAAYVAKPFTRQSLLAAVQTAFESSRA